MPPLAREEIRAELHRMMALAHPELSEIERDHQSTLLALKSEVQALPGHVEEITRVTAIGRHSIVEFVQKRGPISQTAYAALEAL